MKSLEDHVRSQIEKEIGKSSTIKAYGKPTHDEITDAINGLTQAEFLAKVSENLEEILSSYPPFQVLDYLPINTAPRDELPKWVRYFNRNESHYCWAYWDPTCEGWVEARVNGHRLNPTGWGVNR
jgi:hypothetical protein